MDLKGRIRGVEIGIPGKYSGICECEKAILSQNTGMKVKVLVT